MHSEDLQNNPIDYLDQHSVVCDIRSCHFFTVVFDYWYSDANSISKWNGTPDILSFSFSDDTTFTNLFNVAFSHAAGQWTTAGIPLNIVPVTSSSADILFCGASQEFILNAFGIAVPDDTDGITNYSAVQQYTVLYGYSTKIGNVFTGSTVTFIIDNARNRSTQNYISSTATHEMGHALGWQGHASGSGTVMYAYANSVTILQDPDKLHLYQYYH